MRDIDRIEPFLDKLKGVWKLFPDYRFGQIIYLISDEIGRDIFYPEETEWLEKIQNIIDKQSK